MRMRHESRKGGSFLRSRSGLVLLAFLAIAGFYLVTEHTAHVFGVLPYLLLLACPLLHVFMHGGHGQDDGSSHGPPSPGAREGRGDRYE